MSDAVTTRAYRTLDGLRGVAALIVVTRHVGDVFPAGLFPESFLAVDLFFLLSGFVIAHAYEARLTAARTLGGFLKTRLIRLYPLYALGLAVGVAAKLAEPHPGGFDLAWLAEAIVIGLLMLPAAPPLPMGSSTLDGPTWTLAPELLANLLYAAIVRRAPRLRLWPIVAVGAVALIACERVYGSLDGGWSVERFPLIGARLAFSFFLGVVMFRSRPVRRCGPAAAWACLAAVGGALMLHPHGVLRQVYELACVLLVFPLAVAAAVRREPGVASARVFAGLGAVSYAVYVLHQPLGTLMANVSRRLDVALVPSAAAGLAFLAAAVGLSALADRMYDTPVRRWLTRMSDGGQRNWLRSAQLWLSQGAGRSRASISS